MYAVSHGLWVLFSHQIMQLRELQQVFTSPSLIYLQTHTPTHTCHTFYDMSSEQRVASRFITESTLISREVREQSLLTIHTVEYMADPFLT